MNGVARDGHDGRPVLAFPAENGDAGEFERRGMIDALGDLLAARAIRHELHLWGYDVPHDWPSWRAQLAHHLPRFC